MNLNANIYRAINFAGILLLLSSCVIHLKPGISWCTNKTCIYDAYGLYKVKDFSRHTKMMVASAGRQIKRYGKHHEPYRVASRKVPVKNTDAVPQMVMDTVLQVAAVPVKIIDTVKTETLRINFAFDKDVISAQDKINIKHYIANVSNSLNAQIIIKGFTDNAGTEGYNHDLSARRAKRVYDYLVFLGLSPLKLSYQAFDFQNPVSDNATEEGRSLNRRVEIEIRYTKEL